MRRPETWACGDESVAVYFGQCLPRDDDERRPARRAGWANGSESDHREQGDPVGMATLMILFHKAELSPCRYMNPGKGPFQRANKYNLRPWLSHTRAQKN